MSTTLLREAIRRALRSSSLAGATMAMGVAGNALAQNATAPPADQKSQALETIVVTGSNIRRVDIETANPVVTIDRAAILTSGKLTLGDLVENLPVATGPSMNPTVNNAGGSGSTLVGLRGLGFQRTLVLVDGQRVLNKDLNSIPAAAVERIEVLTEGASAVYGSDAIGGVVNVILRQNYQGAEFTVNYGISDRDDGQRKGYSFIFGQTSDKGSLMAGIDYNKTESVLAGKRDFARDALSITGSPATPPYTYVGGSSFPPSLNIQLPAGPIKDHYGCNNVALNQGASGADVLTDFHCFGNADKYNFAPVNLVQTPQERTNLFVTGVYHLTDNIDAYATGYHNKTSSGFQLAPALFGATAGAQISKDNLYNPFGVDFNRDNGYDYRARLVPAGNRAARSNNAIDQFNVGFKGNLTILDQDWSWNAGYNYGHTSTVDTVLGLPDQNLLNLASGPSMLIDGVPRCVATAGDPNTKIDGCVPFNPFNLFSDVSKQVLAAVAAPALENFYRIEKTEHVDFSGGLFNLPAGTAQLAVGAAYRKEYTRAVIDPVLLISPDTGLCTLGSQCSSSLQGGFTVKEAYGELFVPLLKDMPFANALNLTVGDRYSKYTTFGSTSNWKVSIEYRPIDDLLLRGTVSKVFRAPSVSDVFGNPVSSAPKLNSDPCDHITVANPACVGVPLDGTFVDTNVALQQQINAVAAGSNYSNFPLGPENGKSFDVGFVYSPHWIEGLSVSTDVYRVYLLNTITAIGAQNVLDLCFKGQTQYCPLISRKPLTSNDPGQIAQIIQPTGNLGRTDTKGVDLTVRYRLPQLSFGQFNVGLDATYLSQYNLQTAPGTDANQILTGAGKFGGFGSPLASACPSGNGGVCLFPRWKAQTFVNWNMGPWDASWTMRYIGRFQVGSPNLAQGSTAVPSYPGYVIKYGATVYHNVQVGYNVEPLNTRFDIGVDNVGDKQPPILYGNNTLNANTDPSSFDVIGRYYFARVTVKF